MIDITINWKSMKRLQERQMNRCIEFEKLLTKASEDTRKDKNIVNNRHMAAEKFSMWD